MPQDVYVDLRYQGIELGSRLCMQEFTESAAYLQCPQPMPVGSALQVQVADDLQIELRVQRVHEQVAGNDKPPGMEVGAVGLEGPAREWWANQVSAPAANAESAPAAEESASDTVVMAAATPEDVAAAPAEASPDDDDGKAAKAKSESKAKSEPEAEPSGGKSKKRRRRKKR